MSAGRWRRFRREFRHNFYAGAVVRDLNYSLDMTDRALDGLDACVAALEEVIAAGWPRSMVLRRLRRELRASVAGYDHMPPCFRGRRLEWAGEQAILSAMWFRKLHQDG